MENFSNQIYNMDCMDLFRQLPDGCVSMILTDPPYGIQYQNNFSRHPHPLIAGDSGIDYEHFARESFRVLQNNAHAYFFTRFDCYPYHYECLRRAGFSIKNCLVIEKGTVGGIGDLRGSYANNAEWIIFCQKGRREFQNTTLLKNRKKEGTRPRPGANPTKRYKTRFNACWFGAEYPKATHNSVWQKKNQIFHPTIKNEVCLSWRENWCSMVLWAAAVRRLRQFLRGDDIWALKLTGPILSWRERELQKQEVTHIYESFERSRGSQGNAALDGRK